ncbi:MAG: helix-turn-helix domain-containing protein [Bacteroidota bacterium]
MKKEHLKLEAASREYLEGLLSKGSLTANGFRRITALLELDRGKTFAEVAQTLNVGNHTVSIWCKAYHSNGLTFLTDKPRSGRPITIDGNQRAKVTALACSEAPEGHGRWTLRLLAEKAVELSYCEHLSHDYASEILKKTNSSLTSNALGASGK